MYLRTAVLLLKGYLLLLVTAAGALAGANIFGVLAGLATELFSDGHHAPKSDLYMWGVHGGWCIGAGIAFVGAILKHRRSKKRDSDDPLKKRSWIQSSRTKPSGILSSIGSFGVVGGILGLLVGGSFALLWFSVAYSPFAPKDWATSIKSMPNPKVGAVREFSWVATSHPVAVYAFGAPIVLGVTAGAIVGGVGAAMGKVEDIE